MIRKIPYTDCPGSPRTPAQRMSWKSIRLELGRTGEFPTGSVSRAYLIRLPLDDNDQVDPRAFDSAPHRATFRRHWSTEPDERGQITRHGDDWQIGFNGQSRLLRIDAHPVRLGEQVMIEDHDGHALPFRIASIR